MDRLNFMGVNYENAPNKPDGHGWRGNVISPMVSGRFVSGKHARCHLLEDDNQPNDGKWIILEPAMTRPELIKTSAQASLSAIPSKRSQVFLLFLQLIEPVPEAPFVTTY
jgi:hypothetical protein